MTTTPVTDEREFIGAYFTCAMWSSTDRQERPLDDNFGPRDIDAEGAYSMAMDCADFLDSEAELIEASGLGTDQAGHDFWLTRNGHGAGFWDRGIGEVGEKLSAAARAYGSQDLLDNDDGSLSAFG